MARAKKNCDTPWVNLSPYEWSMCKRTGHLKPPRAHYDSVSKSLVMNLDHHCPWMGNAVSKQSYTAKQMDAMVCTYS
jgi:hypothetical protein